MFHQFLSRKGTTLFGFVLIGLFCADLTTAASSVIFSQLPKNMQLFPRDDNDSGDVTVSGCVIGSGSDSLIVTVNKAGVPWHRSASSLQYQLDTAFFYFALKIHAELSEYRVSVYLGDSLVAQCDSLVCGDAYLIDGQSNAEASSDYNYRSEWIRGMSYGLWG